MSKIRREVLELHLEVPFVVFSYANCLVPKMCTIS